MIKEGNKEGERLKRELSFCFIPPFGLKLRPCFCLVVREDMKPFAIITNKIKVFKFSS